MRVAAATLPYDSTVCKEMWIGYGLSKFGFGLLEMIIIGGFLSKFELFVFQMIIGDRPLGINC